jgi:glutamate synthase (NADPH/NADH) small chain
VFPIVHRQQLNENTFLWHVAAPDVAQAARPGHFVMVRIDATGERIPLTVADYNVERGTVTVVIQAVGKTTRQMMELDAGDSVLDFVGPLGMPSRIEARQKVVLVGGGLGVAPIFPQLRAYKRLGTTTVSILGFRTRELVFWEDRFREFSDLCVVATDDGSYGTRGLVSQVLERVLGEHPDVDEVVAIGPLPMMKACAEVTRPFGVRTLVSLNSIMVDGTGMCGSCRVTVGGVIRFACVDGPDFDAHQVNFDELMLRQKRFEREEKAALERYLRETELLAAAGAGLAGRDPAVAPARRRAIPRDRDVDPAVAAADGAVSETSSAVGAVGAGCGAEGTAAAGDARPKSIRTVAPKRTPMAEQPAAERVGNFEEVALGYSLREAIVEADRCLECKKPRCVAGCPVEIDIPAFIGALRRGDLRGSYRVLKSANSLPAVCGRVCPQETQCEVQCVVGKKLEPVAIGRLERFVADRAVGMGWDEEPPVRQNGARRFRAAMIGSGPASLACAGDLARAGVGVTIYEALHVAGGVLKYGIPEFRLPNDTVDLEIENLQAMGVEIVLDTVIGKVFTILDLLGAKGFDAVFIGTGAGSPSFQGIPGESLNGVFSANEFLSRVNLMMGYRAPLYDTPVGMGRRVAVIGAGNTAMDAARVARRLGAESVTIVYRRSERECPARAEELHHAIDEGIRVEWLTNPVRIFGNPSGWVAGMECLRMELGEPDESGRRRPVPRPGTEFRLDVDTVIYALGTTANPIIAQTTPGLVTNRWGYLAADPETAMTSLAGVFAGGDIVTGSATVIQAMGAGRKAARGILRYLGVVAGTASPVTAPAPVAS